MRLANLATKEHTVFMKRITPLFWTLVALMSAGRLPADEPDRKTANADKANSQTVEQLAENAKKSIVVIHYTGRDGRQVGLGTGFVLDKSGLIATNFHV